ncbi:MAG: BMP family ABC transporter substrate-binding protein [Clostridia bacterium]|nr:BMP family ABC transporter substrate-binding protein [Clostridia bacterium]
MKKLFAILLAVVMILGCASVFAEAVDYDAIPDEMTSDNGKYPIAFVTDVGQLKDGSFNEGIFNGVKRFASENNIAYKYYQPANGQEATGDDRYDAMLAAVNNGAEIVVVSGFMAQVEVEKLAKLYSQVKWVWVDGESYMDGEPFEKNTIGISFREEECGYFAGYATVKDGFTKLGFSGGGGGTNPACCRYGYGFVQGAEAAAEELGVQVEMKFSWLYGATFTDSPELQAMLNGWYESGTEVIFPCGGQMYKSCFAAAAANEAWTMGVDSDYASKSEWVLTSPLKGVGAATYDILKAYYEGKWDEFGGTSPVYGTKEGAIALPTSEESWRFKKFTVEDYNKMVEAVLSGEIKIDNKYENQKEEYPNLKIEIVK